MWFIRSNETLIGSGCYAPEAYKYSQGYGIEMMKACNCLCYRLFQRKERDSNPRYDKRTTVFETVPIDHSGIFP